MANSSPGKLKRLSVAVAISAKALKNKNTDVAQIQQLVSAAVGLNATRGDQVAVVARDFSKAEDEGLPFYETGWFASLVRNGVALIARAAGAAAGRASDDQGAARRSEARR